MLQFCPFQLPMEAELSGPTPAGVNVKNMWQAWPGFSVWPWQSCAPLKFPGGAPPAPLMTTGALLTFRMLTICCGEVRPVRTSAKSMPAVLTRNRSVGEPVIPVPFIGMLKLCPFQLPIDAEESAPAAVGWNVKNMWQVAPGARVWPWQSCAPLKSPGGAPPAPLMTMFVVPMFVMFTVSLLDVVFTATSPKSRRAGVIRNRGGMPSPRILMLKACPFQLPMD